MITINGAIYSSPFRFSYWRVLFWIEVGGNFYTTGSISISKNIHKKLMFKRAINYVSFIRRFTRSEFELEMKKADNYKTLQFEIKREVLLGLVKDSLPVSSSAYCEVRKGLIRELKKEEC